MVKPNVANIIKNAQKAVTKHSPEILTGIGIAGMITTTILAVRATPKALRLMDDAAQEKGDRLDVKEKVKSCWKCYIPAAVTGTASVACLIGANSVHLKRNTTLAAAYKLSETALTEYRSKVVETIGEKKEKAVRDKVAEEQIRKNPVSKNDIHFTGKGEVLCYEPLSARYFKSDVEAIKRAENNLNKRILTDICGRVSLNEFYDELELPHTDLGDNMYWTLDNTINLDFSSWLNENNVPCLVVGHYNAPQYDLY